VPITNINDIVPILKLIEKDSNRAPLDTGDKNLNELMSIVTDCGLSQTTLEEVFMIVTGKKEAKEKKAIIADQSYTPDKAASFADDYTPKKFEEVKGVEEDEDLSPRNFKLNDSF
jgi:hypothetical protein